MASNAQTEKLSNIGITAQSRRFANDIAERTGYPKSIVIEMALKLLNEHPSIVSLEDKLSPVERARQQAAQLLSQDDDEDGFGLHTVKSA